MAARCAICDYCKIVRANGGWSFYGCFYKPYKGKWVAEIKDCPKKKEENLTTLFKNSLNNLP